MALSREANEARRDYAGGFQVCVLATENIPGGNNAPGTRGVKHRSAGLDIAVELSQCLLHPGFSFVATS